jgi:hypothetical protein
MRILNPLMQVVKSEILAREALDEKIFFDNAVLDAIEQYNNEISPPRKAISFFDALTPIWDLYSKRTYVDLFKQYIRMETGLELYSSDYSSHYNHVINEFLFGFCILTNSLLIKENYNFQRGRKSSESEYGELLFSWLAASLFHDVGYDIENSPEEEAFRDFQNKFWSFMTPRVLTVSPLQIDVGGPGKELLDTYIFQKIKMYLSDTIEFREFEELFIRKEVKDSDHWFRYDHGIISALKYLSELKKLDEAHGEGYLSWEPNIRAVLAMAIHNFRYKNCKLRISSNDKNTLISYLLIICDEIQDWERERDQTHEYENSSKKDKTGIKNSELNGLIFRGDYAFLSLNHRLKHPSFRKNFEEFLDEKIIKMRKDYPIRIFIPNEYYLRLSDDYTWGTKIISKDLQYFDVKTMTQPPNFPFWDKMSPITNRENYANLKTATHIEINNETLEKYKFPDDRFMRFLKIKDFKSGDQMLKANSPPYYQIFIDHRIDGIPFVSTIFSI